MVMSGFVDKRTLRHRHIAEIHTHNSYSLRPLILCRRMSLTRKMGHTHLQEAQINRHTERLSHTPKHAMHICQCTLTAWMGKPFPILAGQW